MDLLLVELVISLQSNEPQSNGLQADDIILYAMLEEQEPILLEPQELCSYHEYIDGKPVIVMFLALMAPNSCRLECNVSYDSMIVKKVHAVYRSPVSPHIAPNLPETFVQRQKELQCKGHAIYISSCRTAIALPITGPTVPIPADNVYISYCAYLE